MSSDSRPFAGRFSRRRRFYRRRSKRSSRRGGGWEASDCTSSERGQARFYSRPADPSPSNLSETDKTPLSAPPGAAPAVTKYIGTVTISETWKKAQSEAEPWSYYVTPAGSDHIDLAMYGDGSYLRKEGKAGFAVVCNHVASGTRDRDGRVERSWKFPVLGPPGFMPRWYSSITEALACLTAINMAIDEMEQALTLLQDNLGHRPKTLAFKFFTDNQYWLRAVLKIQEGSDRGVRSKYQLILRFVLDEIAYWAMRFDHRMSARGVKLTVELHWIKDHIEPHYHPHTRADELATIAAREGCRLNGLTPLGGRLFDRLAEWQNLPWDIGDW